eukprot:tig00021035_g17267.t1
MTATEISCVAPALPSARRALLQARFAPGTPYDLVIRPTVAGAFTPFLLGGAFEWTSVTTGAAGAGAAGCNPPYSECTPKLWFQVSAASAPPAPGAHALGLVAAACLSLLSAALVGGLGL